VLTLPGTVVADRIPTSSEPHDGTETIDGGGTLSSMSVTYPAPGRSVGEGLVERDEHLAALHGYLQEAGEGNGRFVLVRGESGIGKTALLREFVRACPPVVTVLSGACDGVSTPQPFGPLEDMVPVLGPELRALLRTDASRAEIDRWLLERLSAGGTHVLIVDDIQWADDATLELLAFLARRLDTLPLLILATFREGERAVPSVTRILGSLATLPVVRYLPLGPLTRVGVASLASGSDVDVDELLRLSGGNPFYIAEALDAGGRGIPASVLDAVRARMTHLDPRARRALEAAAIIGRRVEPWLLAAIAGEDLMGIDDCLKVGLVTKADGIAFRHDLTRMAVLEDLPVIAGIALHRRALDALVRAGAADSARLAYHAEGAADREAVLEHAAAAGRRALTMGALYEATAQFERALRFADVLGPDERAELLEALSQSLFLTNHLPEAYDVGREAVALRRQAGNLPKVATDLSSLSLTAWCNGRGEEAWAAAREAVAILEPAGDSHGLGMAYATLGRLGVSTGLNDDARDSSEQALAIGRRLGDPEVSAIALASIGTVRLSEGDDTGWAMLEESLRMGREARLPAVVDRALNNLGVSAATDRRHRIAETYFSDLEEHSDRSEIERCSIDAPRAEIALALGDWEAAERHARAAFVAPRTDPIDRSVAMIVLARLGIRRGEDGWGQWLVEPAELAAGLQTNQLRWPLASCAAEEAWLAGELEAAVPDLEAAYRDACRQREPWVIGELGRWLWRAGAISTIDDHAAEPYRLEVAGDTQAAVAAWERLDVPYEAALCRAESPDPAEVSRAYVELTRLGASRVAHRVALRLRDMGTPIPRGPRPTTRANPMGLTEREAEIAGLLAAGLSNGEIADRLVLSRKTVGHHVSAVLGKLAVRRRAEVASALRGIGAPV
jgi:DNA-binding CsgD family transcriptional regulator/tetratricopeptide (TPR) repeat protein